MSAASAHVPLESLSGDELRDALRHVDRSLAEDPFDGRLWELKGNILARLGRPTVARSALEHASTLVPLSDASWVAMAVALAEEGRADRATATVSTLMEQRRVDPTAIGHAIDLLVALDKGEFAIELARRACDAEPDSPAAYHRLAVLCSHGRRPEQVVESLYRRAMLLAPEQIDYRIAFATFLFGRQRLGRAYTVLKVLSDDDICGVTCDCCLRRLRDIFVQVGDLDRADVCVAALEALAASPRKTSC